MKVVKEEKSLTELEKAKAVIAQERQEREQRCRKRLETLLEEEQCEIHIQVRLNNLTIVPAIILVAKE